MARGLHAPHAASASHAAHRLGRHAAPYLMSAPAAALVLIFVVGTLSGVLQGFGIMPFLGRTTPTLAYFEQALGREDLVASLLFSLKTAGISALVALVGGVVLSWALVKLDARLVGRLVSLQLPLLTMHALVAASVIFLFSGSGLVARILFYLGFVESPSSLPSVVGATSGWGIIVTYAWKEVPYVAFCTVALMAHVSGGLSEAAASLGATERQTFWYVSLPLCLPAALRATLVVFVFAFGSYEVAFLLGPSAPKALPVLAYLEFLDPDILNRSYAMALNALVTLISTCAALAYVWLMRIEQKRGEHGIRR
ncbi:MAG: ABC transporter permease [Atopobiaceae bacterium]|jgi:putative spermidine/putrescine transport system permease protein